MDSTVFNMNEKDSFNCVRCKGLITVRERKEDEWIFIYCDQCGQEHEVFLESQPGKFEESKSD